MRRRSVVTLTEPPQAQGDVTCPVNTIRESVEAVELEILSRIPDEALEQAAETLRALKETLLEMAGREAEENENAEGPCHASDGAPPFDG